MLNFSALLADGPLPDPTTVRSPANISPDPTIDHGGQALIYMGLFLLILGITAVVGFFSRRVEHALITALVLSFGLIAVFIFIR